MSHLSVLHKIVQSGIESAVILEDDTELPDDFEFNLHTVVRNLPADFDIAYLAYNMEMHLNVNFPNVGPVDIRFDSPHTKPAISGAPEVVRVNRAWGLTAYLISRKGAQKILDLARSHEPYNADTYQIATGVGYFKELHTPSDFTPTDRSMDIMVMMHLAKLQAYVSWPAIVSRNLAVTD